MNKAADAVTVISQKVKKDLSKFYHGNIDVIYNPAKDVNLDETMKKENKFLYVGRANDPIKRIKLAYEALKLLKKTDDLIICGMEDPKFGKYLGVVKDEDLSKYYNSTKFVLLPSRAEGIGLSMIEGMICGSVPLMCSDNLTAKEFSPKEFICEPSPEALKNKIEEIDKDYSKYRKLALEYGKKYKKQFSKQNIANNIFEVYKKYKIE